MAFDCIVSSRATQTDCRESSQPPITRLVSYRKPFPMITLTLCGAPALVGSYFRFSQSGPPASFE